MEAALSALRAENSDLRVQLRLERAEWATERQTLVDRLLALSAPAALREVRRAPPQEPAPSALATDRPRRIHYPGYTSYLRPPSPPHPPALGGVSLSDGDRYSVLLDKDDREES
jgi:hypothetical protein